MFVCLWGVSNTKNNIETQIKPKPKIKNVGLRFKVDFYHADRTAMEKARVHREWSAGRIHLICATIAFGMGET